MADYLFEVAVDSIESALIAQENGAHRIELCADLGIGGITPSHGMIELARERLSIPVHVMIRPRRGDFLYTEPEYEIMRADIEFAKSVGVQGVVFGVLEPDGTIDTDRTRVLIEQARPMNITFHRAFDMTPDPHVALRDLLQLRVDRVLTSGQKQTAEDGLSMIAELVNSAGNDLIVMPGSGINPANIRHIITTCGAREFHFSAKKPADSPVQYRNPHLSMGGTDQPDEYSRAYADGETIRAIIANATA